MMDVNDKSTKNSKNKLGINNQKEIMNDIYSRLSQNSRGSQRSNKTNATSQGGRQNTSMTMNFIKPNKKSFKKPITLRKSSSKNSHQMSSLNGSIGTSQNQHTQFQMIQLSQNSTTQARQKEESSPNRLNQQHINNNDVNH